MKYYFLFSLFFGFALGASSSAFACTCACSDELPRVADLLKENDRIFVVQVIDDDQLEVVKTWNGPKTGTKLKSTKYGGNCHYRWTGKKFWVVLGTVENNTLRRPSLCDDGLTVGVDEVPSQKEHAVFAIELGQSAREAGRFCPSDNQRIFGGYDAPKKRTKKSVRKIVKQNAATFRECSATSNAKDLTGFVRIRFWVEPIGIVSKTKIESDGFSETAVGRCIEKAVRKLRFEKIRAKNTLQVVYPFKVWNTNERETPSD